LNVRILMIPVSACLSLFPKLIYFPRFFKRLVMVFCKERLPFALNPRISLHFSFLTSLLFNKNLPFSPVYSRLERNPPSFFDWMALLPTAIGFLSTLSPSPPAQDLDLIESVSLFFVFLRDSHPLFSVFEPVPSFPFFFYIPSRRTYFPQFQLALICRFL